MLGQGIIHVCVIGNEVEALAFRERVMGDRPIHLHVFGSVRDFQKSSNTKIYYSGIVLDSKIALRMSQEEKEYFRVAFEDRMPVFEAVLSSGDTKDVINEKLFRTKWANFLRQAELFNPRGKRFKPRKFCILRVEICEGPQWDTSKSTRAITSDLSVGGCFVVTPEDVPEGQKVLLKIDGIPEVIQCRVAWLRTWESTRNKWPGVGLEFANLPSEVQLQISRLFGTLE